MKCQDKSCCTCVCSSLCDEWRTTEPELTKFQSVNELRNNRAVKVTKFQGGDYGTATIENQAVKWIHGGCEPHPFKVLDLAPNTLTFREEKDLSNITIFGNIFKEMTKGGES